MTEKPIRILRLIARLNIGGPAIQAITLSSELSTDFYQTLLACGKVSPGEGDMNYLAGEKGVKPLIIPGFGRELSFWDDLKSFFYFLKIIREFRPHILHTHTAKAGALGRLAAITINWTSLSRSRIRVIHTFHGHIFHGYFNRLKTFIFIQIERFLARFTDRIIVISPLQKRDICENFNIAEKKRVKIIPLGFDLSVFHDCGLQRRRARKEYIPYTSQESFLVGMIGRLTSVKNHQMLFNAVRYLKDLGKSDFFRFVIVGDGELKESLIEDAQRLKIQDVIIFTGWQKDMASVYAALDAVVLTSKNEGTPVAIIEAMAAERPVVATNVGGVPDLLGKIQEENPAGFKRAERGILVPHDNMKALASALLFLSENQNALIEMTGPAKYFVLNRFSKERLIRDIHTLYSELILNDIKSPEDIKNRLKNRFR